jgi:threonylcarbamoyladenosine tRNA methylthiotransferase CDKAL1
MAGALQAYGYALVDDGAAADLWLINTCTVKSPSQSAMDSLLSAGRAAGKALLVAGCVPQGDRNASALEGLSLLGVTQIDRVVEAARETLAGNTVRLLARKALPSLDLPKVRRNAHVEIVPLSTGCLGSCSYCKTVHARGALGSYAPEALRHRVAAAVAEGVTEIWLSSEDTGAYGRDLGTDLSALLAQLLPLLPPDGRTMLRLGMTNPPFILHQLDAVAAALNHPCVYSCIHLPVQSGSDAVLERMRREYTVAEFCTVVDTLRARVPGLALHTDIICGHPGETDEDFEATLELVRRYQPPVVNISQFYARPGTPSARMARVPSQAVKARSRALTALHESYSPHAPLVGTLQRAWFTEVAADGVQLAGRTKSGVQLLCAPQPGLMGASAMLRVTAAGRWSVSGELIEIVTTPRVTVAQPLLPAAEAACSAGAECCGGSSEACCAASEAPMPPATPPAQPPAARPEEAPLLPPAKVSAASPFGGVAAMAPPADWYEAALWTGVLAALGGVFCAGVMHLATAR